MGWSGVRSVGRNFPSLGQMSIVGQGMDGRILQVRGQVGNPEQATGRYDIPQSWVGGPGAGDPNSKRTGGQAVVRQKVKNEVSQHGRGIKKPSAGRSAGKWGSEGEGVCTQGAEARRECEFLVHIALRDKYPPHLFPAASDAVSVHLPMV